MMMSCFGSNGNEDYLSTVLGNERVTRGYRTVSISLIVNLYNVINWFINMYLSSNVNLRILHIFII